MRQMLPERGCNETAQESTQKTKDKIEMESDVSESEDVSGEITMKEWKQSSYLFSLTYSIYLSHHLWKYKKLNIKYFTTRIVLNSFFFLFVNNYPFFS